MGQLANDVQSILGNKNENKEIKQERQKVLDQIANDEAAKTNLVKKALAKQRAAYGAGGMTGKGMTEEAVLRRMRDETEEPFNDKKRSNMDKLSKLRKLKKTNLLKSIISNFEKIMN
ncbi:MAG: hypothetical protein LBK26_00505 [Rickettsiales bacterium]|jgi:hypothetical protein|nr:hypothetical protein [Rickettsiales bacterium]